MWRAVFAVLLTGSLHAFQGVGPVVELGTSRSGNVLRYRFIGVPQVWLR